MGKRIRWRTEKLWALEAAGPERPDVLWCGTLPGGLFRSDDAGDNWQLNRPLWDHPGRKQWFGGGADYPGIHSISVDPRDSRRLLIGVSCGGVWWSGDDGESWTLRADGMRAAYMPPDRANDPGIQDPHCIARCGRERRSPRDGKHDGFVVGHGESGRQTCVSRHLPPIYAVRFVR